MTKCIMTLNFTDVFTAADYLLEKRSLKIKQRQHLLRSGFRFSNMLSAESNYKSEQL